MHKYYHVACYPMLFKGHQYGTYLYPTFYWTMLFFFHSDTHNSWLILTVFFCIFLQILKLSSSLLMNILVVSNFSITNNTTIRFGTSPCTEGLGVYISPTSLNFAKLVSKVIELVYCVCKQRLGGPKY